MPGVAGRQSDRIRAPHHPTDHTCKIRPWRVARHHPAPIRTGRQLTAFCAYAGLFLSALVAATILPAQSEAVLAVMLASKAYSALLLLAVASAGNVLGAVINWFLGREVLRFAGRRWFPVTPAALQSASKWYHRYGRWSLLASWLPVVGDPLTVVAGVLREPFWSFLVLVTIGKTARYAVLGWIVLSWT